MNTWRIIRIIPPQHMSSIKRVGIVLKPHQPQALKTICELTVWLGQRGIQLVGGPQIERERIEHETGCAVREVELDALAGASDLVLVLGGDTPTLGLPTVAGASVAAEVLQHKRGPKVIAFKKRRRKNSRRKRGYRDELTVLRVTEILTDNNKPTVGPRPKKAKAEPKAEAAE